MGGSHVPIVAKNPVQTFAPPTEGFFPLPPKTLAETGLNQLALEDLIFKTLLSNGVLSGRELAARLCLEFPLVEGLLGDLKNRLLLAHRSTASMGDFIYQLTDQGREKGLMAREISAYVGPAPIPFEAYLKSIRAQSIQHEKPQVAQLRQAFSDLTLDPAMFDILGPAVNSARGLFLYGEPGNGKTSIAERICRCFKQDIFIPQALTIDGQIMTLYDAQTHTAVQTDEPYDRRWMKIKRPVVVVGGELTMEALEITYNPLIKISEAPLQLKANGGTFLIDDFGRQRVSHLDLLNRWIVPLEKRIDYLVLPNGKKIEVPFDELIIFSTNLNPKDLVDEAFLRRISYKINIESPTEPQFRNLFQFMCDRLGIAYQDDVVSYLIDRHYRGKREFRACQPRDLLSQVMNAASYYGQTPVMTPESMDLACQNYFAAMGK
jgi:predicted ATPase with chaperone activity